MTEHGKLIDADALIKAVIEESYQDGSYGYMDTKSIIELIEDAPTIEPEQHWIPCSERLPDNEKRVLCTVQSGEHFCVVPCIFIQHTRRWLPEVYGNHDNVIAWMPLPEPYKADMRGEEDGGI